MMHPARAQQRRISATTNIGTDAGEKRSQNSQYIYSNERQLRMFTKVETPRRRTGILAIAVSTALLAAACGSSSSGGAPAAKKPIIIGAAIGQTGALSGFDVPASQAAQFAVDNINAKGGVLGRPLKIIYVNTDSVPANGTAAADELISEGAQLILVSCDFDYGSPAALAAQAKSVLSFSLCAGSTQFGEPLLPFSYTLNDPDIDDATVAADFAYQDKHFKSAYILEDTSIQYTKNLATYFPEVWKTLPGTSIAGSDTFSETDISIATQISRIKALSPQPDFIYLASLVPGGVSAVRQIRAAGINLPIVAGNGLDGTTWEKAVPGLSNFYVNYIVDTLGNDPSAAVNSLVKEFIAKTGSAPAHSIAIPGYSVIQAFAVAAQRAGSLSTAALQKALNSFKNVPLLVGPTTFTAKYHITLNRPMAVVQVQNGKSSFVKYVTPKNEPPVLP
jgi:branched-chain amino acid transport system substrate-binding protein